MGWYDGFEIAVEHWKAGKLDEASVLFSALIIQYPFIPRIFHARGKVYFERKQYDLAIEDFTQATRLRRLNYHYYASRGITHLEAGNYNEAERDLRYSRYLSKGKEKYDYSLGRIYMKQGNYIRAEEHLSRAVKEFRGPQKSLHKLLGLCYLRLKRYSKAYNSFVVAEGYLPNDYMTILSIGRCQYEMGKNELDLSLTEILKQKNPTFPKYTPAVECLKFAIYHFDKAIKIDPNNVFAHFLRGETNSYLGNFKEAAEDFSTCIRLKPENEEFYRLWLYAKELGE